MSFSSETKNELSRLKLESESLELAELSSFMRMNGSVSLSSNRGTEIEFLTENSAVARRLFTLVKKLYGVFTEVSVSKNTQLKKNNLYSIKIKDTDSANDFLKKVHMVDDEHNVFSLNYNVPKSLLKNTEEVRAYIRAAFLAAGSITNPEKGYHLEYVSNTREHAKGLSSLINSFGVNSKVIKRKETYVCYVKDSEKISDCLNVMGAFQALLKYEDVRAMKDFRNGINRLVNCETANLSKTVEASMRQIYAIEKIDNTIGISSLPENLREIAYLRLSNEELSLAELGKLMIPEVSKAVVNQRLRRIEKISEKL